MAISAHRKINKLQEIVGNKGGLYEAVTYIDIDWCTFDSNKIMIKKITEALEKDVDIFKIVIEAGKPIRIHYYPTKDELKRIIND